MPKRASAALDVYRSTTYELQAGEFTGTTYTLTLNNDLQSDYFTMISGPSDPAGTRGPGQDSARVSGDPFSNFVTTTSPNQIELTRDVATNDWIGVLTVLECLVECATKGFQLSEVLETSIVAGTASVQQTVTNTLAANYTANTVPFSGRFGGGTSTLSTAGFS